MSRKIRTLIFLLFTLVFLSVSTIIVIKTLGYRVDFAASKLSHANIIDIKTNPSQANIQFNINDIQTNKTSPYQLETNDGVKVKIKISKDGFFDENMEVYGNKNENNYTRLTDIYLMPAQPTTISKNTNPEELLTLLDQNQLIKTKENKLYISSYTKNEVLNNDELITIKNTDIQTVIRALKNNNNILNFDNTFYFCDQRILLTKINNEWLIYQLQNLVGAYSNIVVKNSSIFYLLDSDKKLWQYNLLNNEKQFVDSNVTSIAQSVSPKLIWFVKDSVIYSTELDTFNGVDNNNKYTDLTKYNLSWNRLKVVQFYQGFIIQVDQQLFYIQDFRKDNPIMIASDVKTFTKSDQTLYWIDINNSSKYWNFLYGFRKEITTFDLLNSEDISDFVYSKDLKRVLVFTKNSVLSIWNLNNSENKNLINVQPINWISNQSCLTNINDFSITCLQDSQLIQTYQNKQLGDIFN